jgi:outer membrane protein with beta-barrel domain
MARSLFHLEVIRAAVRGGRSALSCLALVLLFLSGAALGQADMGHLELHGGYAHITGDGGLDGFNAGAALRFNRRVSVALDYDSTWDRTVPTAFITNNLGAVIVRSYLANYLIGPRIFFPAKKLTIKDQQFIPFGEFQFGGSHLSSTVEALSVGSQKSSSNAYSWLIGGGADYGFSRHWSGRINADLLRTHFSDTGQSRFRLVLGIVYSFAGGGH